MEYTQDFHRHLVSEIGLFVKNDRSILANGKIRTSESIFSNQLSFRTQLSTAELSNS